MANKKSGSTKSAKKTSSTFTPPRPRTVKAVLKLLDEHFPEVKTALVHHDPFQLLVATILSAQCTDERVNKVTPVLFETFPFVKAMATAEVEAIEAIIRSTGFFRQKAKNIKALSQALVENHHGEVPADLDALVKLPGVGRKTANVVLGACFQVPGVVVDTHVGRISRLLGWTEQKDPVKVEFELMSLIEKEKWTSFSHRLIYLGRSLCIARRPRCFECFLKSHCDHGKNQ